MKSALVTALCSCAGERYRVTARRFLQGLSKDELQYIAEYLGSCILESPAESGSARMQLAEGIAGFDRCRFGRTAKVDDRDHKMILLLEYLSRCGLTQCPPVMRAQPDRIKHYRL